MIKIFIASDHAGIELKSKVFFELTNTAEFSTKYEVFDLGPQSIDSVDYPDFADLVCKKIHGFSLFDTDKEKSTMPKELGILICGSGQGMAMRANKYPHIRAALCWSDEISKLAREHNDANVLCLGARTMDHDLCLKSVHTFLNTKFSGGRHQQRVVKVSNPV